MTLLLWARLLLLVLMAAVVSLHLWTAYRTNEDLER